jgi:RNA polymerase-binding transcription factor DksA
MAKAKPAKPAAKSKKSAPAKPAKGAKKPAVKSAKAAKTAKPAKAAKPAKPRKAAKAVKPAKVAKPVAAKPAKSAKKPALKVKLVKKPVKVPAKVNGDKHKPAEAAKPVQANGRPTKPAKPVVLTPFLKKQQEKLLHLRDAMLDSMMGVAKDNLRTRAEGSEASAFGMHQADAGSDAYDRDFALSLLSQEQDALYEIEEALKRIDFGTYGVCEMSNKPIAHARLEALPFARFTVECQSQIEKQGKVTRARVPVTSLFGLTEEEGGGESEEEEPATDSKE